MLKKTFTLIELTIVIIIIGVLFVSFSKISNNSKLMYNQSIIQEDIKNLEFSIKNFPKDISSEYIDKSYKFKPVSNILVKIDKNGIMDYKYLIKEDYRNYAYDDEENFLGFDKLWNNTLFYDNYIGVKKYISKLSDGWEIKSCSTYSVENSSGVEIKEDFDLEGGDTINILITKYNSFLIKDLSKNINGVDNLKIKKLFCTFTDGYGNPVKFILLF